MSVCPSVRPSISNMHELLLTYCHSTKNSRNYAFVCLFIGILLLNIKDKIAGYQKPKAHTTLCNLICTLCNFYTRCNCTDLYSLYSSNFFWTAVRLLPDCLDSSQGRVRLIHSRRSEASLSYSSISLSLSWFTFSTLQIRLAAISA